MKAAVLVGSVLSAAIAAVPLIARNARYRRLAEEEKRATDQAAAR